MTVTCVCPTTAARRLWLPRAIKCFQAQTYQDRELLIVTDPGYSPEVPPDPRIRVIEAPPRIRLGEKRNFCSENAGSIIAHWDDDDWSAPERLELQMERLQKSGKAVTGYRFMKFTDGVRWWRYEGDSTYAFDTSLLYRREWWASHPFDGEQSGFDVIFVARARGSRQIEIADCGDVMYATNHAANTSPRTILAGDSWIPVDCPAAFASHSFPEVVAA